MISDTKQVAEKAASAFGDDTSISYASAKGRPLATEISGCGIYLFDVSVPLSQSALSYTCHLYTDTEIGEG